MTGTVQYPLAPTASAEPAQILAELRRREPVSRVTLWNGKPAWLITRLSDARRALTDPRLSADATDPNFPSMNPSQVIPNYRGGPARMHEGRHGQIRKMVASKFTIRAVDAWRPISQRIVDEQLAALRRDGPPADLVTRFALPVPLRLVCYLLGVPAADIPFVERDSQLIITRAYESSQPALRRIRDYVDELVRCGEKEPGDDLIGQLVVEQVRPGALTREELVDLALILLVAGHTTTASTIGLGVVSLLEDPDTYRALHDDPALVVPIVEEFLRYQTIVSDGAPRVAKEDLELAGTRIRTGDAVIVSLTAANRDEAAFADPDVLDVHRADARRHIAFGWGAHRCLGQHVARMELQNAFAALARELPALRLAVPMERLHYGQRDKHLNHVSELPVTW